MVIGDILARVMFDMINNNCASQTIDQSLSPTIYYLIAYLLNRNWIRPDVTTDDMLKSIELLPPSQIDVVSKQCVDYCRKSIMINETIDGLMHCRYALRRTSTLSDYSYLPDTCALRAIVNYIYKHHDSIDQLKARMLLNTMILIDGRQLPPFDWYRLVIDWLPYTLIRDQRLQLAIQQRDRESLSIILMDMKTVDQLASIIDLISNNELIRLFIGCIDVDPTRSWCVIDRCNSIGGNVDCLVRIWLHHLVPIQSSSILSTALFEQYRPIVNASTIDYYHRQLPMMSIFLRAKDIRWLGRCDFDALYRTVSMMSLNERYVQIGYQSH
jgi:hypothetical protein